MTSRVWSMVFAGLSSGLLADASADPGRFDASRLKTGAFTYRDTINGKPGSLSTCTVSSAADGQYRFTCDFPSYEQSWSTLATRSMTPVATTLKMRTREGRHYELTLTYEGRHVSGEAVTSASADGKLPGSDESVAADIVDDTVDQRVDWASVMTVDMQPGRKFGFKVYDAKTGVSRVSCTVGDAGTMKTVLGPVHAIRLDYTVYKASGTESYTVYTSSAFPRVMLREDLPGGLVSELVKVDR